MKIDRGFSKKSNGTLSSLLCAIILLVSQIFALNSVDESEDLHSENRVEHRGRKNALEGTTKLRARNSPALNHFLEDVLKAREELKWIDRAVHQSGNARNVDSSPSRRRKSRDDGKVRSEYEKPRRIQDEDENKEKREVDDAPRKSDLASSSSSSSSPSSSSLASLKRTIIELRDSLNPAAVNDEESEINEMEDEKYHGKRKLLTSLDVNSAMDIAIAYYDYDEDAAGDSAGDAAAPLTLNHQMEREIKQDQPPNSVPDSPVNQEMKKIDKNLEEEKKEELMNERSKNKWPKEEFISDVASSDEEKQNPTDNAVVLKRIADQDSESSDYSQWMSERSREKISEQKKTNISNLPSIERSIDDKISIDEPISAKERTYLVISPSIVKRTKKRSVNFAKDARNSSQKLSAADADNSAKNYAALKSTDDMFKGGSEQSNSLGEDKVIYEASSLLPPAQSSAKDSPILSRSFKVRTTSPEWKVIEAIDRKNFPPKNSIRSMRGFGRRLTQIVGEISPNETTSLSSTISSPTTSLATSTEIVLATRNLDAKIENPSEGKIVVSALGKRLFPSEDKVDENTRLKRHVTYEGEKRPRHRKRRTHKRRKSRQNHSGRKRQSLRGYDQGNKLTILLAADNIEDESQIDQAIHGELAGKIVEKIFEQVQRNEGIKVALGPGLYRRHRPEESMVLDKMYRQGLDENEASFDVKETEAMMRRVMELLGRLVLDEVRRKTCASLAPDMRDFLQWTLGLDETQTMSDQIPPLPLIPGHHDRLSPEKSPFSPDKFLFPNSTNGETRPNDLSELERKVNLLKGLIKEYNALTEREKTKVQTVHDYLVRQLSLLLKYIETKEAAEQSTISKNYRTSGSRIGPQPILQYQASVPDSNLTKSKRNFFNATSLEPPKNHQAHSRLNSGSLIFPYSNDYSRSSGKMVHWTRREKRKSEKFDLHERPSRSNEKESLEYRKLLRRIASLRRKKRASSLGYEIPRIYVVPLETNSTIVSNTENPIDHTLAHDPAYLSPSLPVRGKNRLEDEILLMNKRQAWKRENQRLLEEVAFGKDTRYDDVSSLNNSPFVDNNDNREKRAFNDHLTTLMPLDNRPNIVNDIFNYSRSNESSSSLEKKINVFPVDTTSVKSTNDPTTLSRS